MHGAGHGTSWRSIFIALLAAMTMSACDEDLNGRRVAVGPSFEIYAEHVSPLMEKRCGTLDCHGSVFRPMRLYGEVGLRHPFEDNRSGGNATTTAELYANYLSLCSVEPEKVSAVAKDPAGQGVNQLLLVRKARGTEGHKGGKVFNPFDSADECVVGWIRGDNEKAVAKACAEALSKLP